MAEFILELVEGKDAGRTFPVGGDAVAGRDPSQQIPLADDQASRQHARFSVAGGTATIEDLGSRNGTYVNGQVLQGSRQLVPGDRIRMGLTVLELRTQEQVAAQASVVGPTPQITAIGADVLRPAAEADLAPVADHAPGQASVGLRVEEAEPAFVPDAVQGAGGAADRDGYDALASLVDGRVKKQTTVAAFALIAISALAVIVLYAVLV